MSSAPESSPARRLIGLAALVALATALAGAAAWLLGAEAIGLGGEELVLAVSVVSAAAAILAGVFAQPLFSAGLAVLLERRQPPLPTPEELERWAVLLRGAVLRRRVLGARSQREQMLRRGTLLELPVCPELEVRAGRSGRPRIRFGAAGDWASIGQHWAAADGRLVILGDPGYGKTFAALALIESIDRGGGGIAELFPLVEWHAWAAGRKQPAIEEWVVDQLLQNYPALSAAAARALVLEGRLMPIFDGLDEVPAGARAECRDALEAYAGRTEPFRPFVVTCRQREYLELAPRWIGADRHVGLVGLDGERVAAALRARFGAAPGWERPIEAVERGDPGLQRLLRSPLRLAAAIEIFEARDPRELLEIAAGPDAAERLWDLLLQADPHDFAGAAEGDVRRWLGFLAASLRSHARQRFWLHELYLYAAPRDRRRFHMLSIGLFTAVVALPALRSGSLFGALVALAIGIVAFGFYRRGRDRPVDHAVRGKPAPLSYLKMLPRAVTFWAFVTVLTALITGPLLLGLFLLADALGEDLAPFRSAAPALLEFTLLAGLFSGAVGAALVLANVGSSYVAEEPPARFVGRGPATVVAATRDHGLVAAGFGAVVFSLPTALFARDPLGFAVFVAFSALLVGWVGGIGAWAFHYWIRWRLARAGLLPYRLGRFLAWASDRTGYLRGADAFEFRHKELLDYLARGVEPVGEGNVSWAEQLAKENSRRAEFKALRGDRLWDRHDYEGARQAYLAAAAMAPDDDVLQGVVRELLDEIGKEAAEDRTVAG